MLKSTRGKLFENYQLPRHFLFIRHRDLAKSVCCFFLVFSKKKQHAGGFWEFWLRFSFLLCLMNMN